MCCIYTKLAWYGIHSLGEVVDLTTLEVLMEKAMGVAVDAAKAGGKILLKYFKEGTYRKRYKEDTSLQTTADIEAEEIIIDKIKKVFPDHSIESEERGLIPSKSSYYQWLIDPLDGTENFFQGISYFSSSIALCRNGRPEIAVVYNPITDECYTAIRGEGAWLNERRIYVSDKVQLKSCSAFFIPDFVTKREDNSVRLRNMLLMKCRRVLDTWSPALDWCLVASGKADMVVAVSGGPIRPDAGTLILEEAKGKITDFHGRSFGSDNSRKIVGSNATSVHSELLRLAKECYFDDDY